MKTNVKIALVDDKGSILYSNSVPTRAEMGYEYTVNNIKQAINNVKEKAGVKGKMLFMPIRIKSTGIMHGPELDYTLYLLGKKKVLENLNR